jgi:hypothetical protein
MNQQAVYDIIAQVNEHGLHGLDNRNTPEGNIIDPGTPISPIPSFKKMHGVIRGCILTYEDNEHLEDSAGKRR